MDYSYEGRVSRRERFTRYVGVLALIFIDILIY